MDPALIDIREACIIAQSAIVNAIMRASKEDRMALFALVAAIQAPCEPASIKGRIAAEFLSPGVTA